ncbi:hypothetical protein WHR41_08377 [Cladosporium halotolerans]|uniref:Zn(2)-C6 fungal-type domain-containing protein n=1 Tax=Cladosporium halotolerans TaxID=1052096 RepID=A0AB34KCR2_9PEZI
MSASPASHVSHESSTRAVRQSTSILAASRSATSARHSIQKHTKTRTGCRTCKKRKIKCDEGRPSCRNCTKHLVQCDFASPATRPNSIVPAEAIAPLNLLDLELMNNFTASTYNTLSNNSTIRSVWKNAIVRKALGCDFLMRALLSVSSIHMAQHRPEQEHLYLSHAIAYHDMASRKAVSLMGTMLPENIEDLWIFSVLTVYFALGSPRNSRSASKYGYDLLPEWMFLFNGVHQIFFALQSTSYAGIVSPLLNHGTELWTISHQPKHENANILHELSSRIDAWVRDEGDAAIYQRAIRSDVVGSVLIGAVLVWLVLAGAGST